MILGAHHVQITVPPGAEDQARDFYCGVLGLPEIEKPSNLKARGGFWLELSNMQVHVGSEPDFDRNKTKAHIAYAVDDLAEIRARLEVAGLSFKESIPIAGYDRFECRDPFGNRMEFIQKL